MTSVYKDAEIVIPNTIIKKRLVDGVLRSYWITPNDGYILHDKCMDYVDLKYLPDEETGWPIEVEIFKRGYTDGMVSCGYFYDFTATQIELDGKHVTAYGDRELCAVLKKEYDEIT